MPNCKHCKKQFPQARFDALKGQPSQSFCIDHAHLAPRVVRTVAPMHKSNSILITNRADLIGLVQMRFGMSKVKGFILLLMCLRIGLRTGVAMNAKK
jgi:hypothetical protein